MEQTTTVQLNESLIKEMIHVAIEQLANAYVPYSGFRVGAAREKRDDLYRMQYRKRGVYTDKLCGTNGFFQSSQRRSQTI